MDQKIKEALSRVKYPGMDQDVVTMGLIKDARVEGVRAIVEMETISAPDEVLEDLENQIAAAMTTIPGVEELELGAPQKKAPQPQPEHKGPQAIPGVKAVVPVASGKGGVGKSTVAVNLAIALSQAGLKVGILDLDLYGPSVPTMLGLGGAVPDGHGDMIVPVEYQGVKTLSIGYMVKADQALIWRGPLVMKAVRQLLHGVAWGPLDVLVLDMPPGTGDIQISLAQETPITGAVVVTTPQTVALADAIKAVEMFKQMKAPIFGMVENMSRFVCPDCGAAHDIFGHGSVEPLCQKEGVEYLGEIPLEPAVREKCDLGTPAVACLPDSQATAAYKKLAGRIQELLAEAEKGK